MAARSRQIRGRRPLIAGLLVIIALGVAFAAYGIGGWLDRTAPPPFAARGAAAQRRNSSPRKASRPVAIAPAQVQHFTVTSAATDGFADTVYVVLPPGYAGHPSERYPVLYLLHGSPGLPLNFLMADRMQYAEAALVAAGQMKPLILVIPTGGRTSKSVEEWANGVSPDNQWETLVATDVVNAVDARYRTISTPGGRGIGGVSEGGYGALNVGLHHPGEFRLIESWSGYMIAENVRTVFGGNARLAAANSPMFTVRKVAAELRSEHMFIWFYCGARDSLIGQNQAFNAELSALRISHFFFGGAPLGHSGALWRHELPEALITASEHLSQPVTPTSARGV
jgi:enterochelin esterase-like enzyme